MIKGFKSRSLKKLYDGDRKAVVRQMVGSAENILTLLDAATTPQALNLPGLKLHMLTGDLKGFYSVKVSPALRIIFRFEDGNAYDVELIDYH